MKQRTLLTTVTLTGVLLLAAGLSACAPETTNGEPPTPTATAPSVTLETTPGHAVTSTANLPSGCDDIASPDTEATVLHGLTLQGDGVGFERPAPPSAELALGCDWIEGEGRGILLLVSIVDPAEAASYAATLPGEGYTCTTGDAGNPVCSMTVATTQPPNSVLVETIVSHGDVWIFQEAVNVDADPLLSDLVSKLSEG